MLCNNFFLLFLQYIIIIRICISQESESSEKDLRLKICTTSNEDKKSILLDETEEENEYLQFLLEIDGELCDSNSTLSNSENTLTCKQDSISNTKNILYEFLDEFFNSQNFSTDLQKSTSDIGKSASNIQSTNSILQDVESYSNYNTNNLENTPKVYHDMDYHLPNLIQGPQYTIINLQNTPHHISTTNLEGALNSLQVPSCSNVESSDLYFHKEKNIRSYKRNIEEKTEHQEKRKKLEDSNNAEEDCINNYMDTTNSVIAASKCERSFMKNLSFPTLEKVFTMDLSELIVHAVPDLQNLSKVLKNNYNIIVRKINSVNHPSKEILEKELTNVNKEYLTKLKLHCVNEMKYKKNKLENTCKFFPLPSSVEEFAFKDKKKISVALINYINDLSKLLEEMNALKKVYRPVSYIINNFLYNELISIKLFKSRKHCLQIFQEMFEVMEDFISSAENAIKNDSFSFDLSKIKNTRKILYSVRSNLSTIYQLSSKCSSILEDMNLSDSDDKIKIQIIFYFFSEMITMNEYCVKSIPKIDGTHDIIKTFSNIVLKQRNRLSEFKQRASEIFNLNTSELNLNSIPLHSLMIGEKRKTLHTLYLKIMKILMYKSLKYQLNLVIGIFHNIKEKIPTTDMQNYEEMKIPRNYNKEDVISELGEYKNTLRTVKLNIKYRILYNSLKEDISNIYTLLETNYNKIKTYLCKFKEILKQLNKKKYIENDDIKKSNCEDELMSLFNLVYVIEMMNNYKIEELK
ncbi:surface-associated interspersed protein (SURFIN) [Plasmodium relictum]|uniref:Surface-associated interspersed protein (SURFIN) n=1 Tax=Plasmodium relictum TaxID=85471 RepID=A0A1J1GKQ3_PLARL|nr:surface-associated interspersed protein (SURFIN) [Plasmodium relictum]CRG84929.1 surface-associated interspersed protein (SURFIN) [Plasmodium relictum]